MQIQQGRGQRRDHKILVGGREIKPQALGEAAAESVEGAALLDVDPWPGRERRQWWRVGRVTRTLVKPLE